MREADLRALSALHDVHGPWALVMLVATIVGGGWGALVLLPMLWHAATRRFAGALSVAIAVQAVLVWAMKFAVGRVRPWIAFGWAAPLGAPRDGSFPSGHAAGSFCVAGFLLLVLPALWPHARARAWLLAGVALLAAGLVATSRVVLGAHFPSDVLGGAVLGAIVGMVAGARFVRG
jgi:undecaprenyl-diphosphatase